MRHSYLTWYMSPPNIIKLSQTVWELWPAQDFGFRGDKYIKQKLSFLHATLLLDLIYVPTRALEILKSESVQPMTMTSSMSPFPKKKIYIYISIYIYFFFLEMGSLMIRVNRLFTAQRSVKCWFFDNVCYRMLLLWLPFCFLIHQALSKTGSALKENNLPPPHPHPHPPTPKHLIFCDFLLAFLHRDLHLKESTIFLFRVDSFSEERQKLFWQLLTSPGNASIPLVAWLKQFGRMTWISKTVFFCMSLHMT